MIDFLLDGPLRFIGRPLFLNILRLIQNGMIFKPNNPETGKINSLLPPNFYKKFNLSGVEPKQIKTSDNLSITTWYKKPPPEGKTILYFPGNTGHFGDCGAGINDDGTITQAGRDYRLALIQEFINNDYGLLAVCYRGFGTSDGKPSEDGLQKDASAAWKFLQDNNINPKDIIVYGDSLGGAVAIKLIASLSADNAPSTLVTTGTFASIAQKAHDLYPQIPIEEFTPYLKHPYNSLEDIKKIQNTEIILMHGDKDKTTYPYHSEMLVNHARESGANARHLPIKNAGHIDISPREIISSLHNKQSSN